MPFGRLVVYLREMDLRSRFGALSERPFRLLWLGQSSSGIGDALVPVALVFAVLEIGGAIGLGLSQACFWGSRALFALAGGVWSDRLPRRLVMLAADVVRAVVQAFLAAVLLTGNAELWMFLVSATLVGTASAFFGPAAQGLIPQTVSAERLQQANALVGLSRSSIGLFGPFVSGLLVAGVGSGWVFAIDAATFVASAAFLARLPIAARARTQRQSFVHDLREGWGEVRSRAWVVAAIASFAASNVAIASYFVLGPLIVDEELGGARDWGLISTGGALGGILGGILALRFSPRHPLRWGFALVAVSGLQLFALVPPLPVVGLALVATAVVVSLNFSNALWATVLQERIPEHALSRVVAYDMLVSFVFMPVGYTIAAPLADAFGLDTVLVAFGVLALVANLGPLLVPSLWHMTRRRDDPPLHAVTDQVPLSSA